MTDLIIFLSPDEYEKGGQVLWKGWGDLHGSYHVIETRDSDDRVIFIDDKNFEGSIKAFKKRSPNSFNNMRLLIQHEGTECGTKNEQKKMVGQPSFLIQEYSKESDNTAWIEDIKPLAEAAQEDLSEAKNLAANLFSKYSVHRAFRLLDQITAKLILKSFGEETEEFSELENIFIQKEGSWLKNACDSNRLNAGALNEFLGVANAEAVKYLKEINPQQATSE